MMNSTFQDAAPINDEITENVSSGTASVQFRVRCESLGHGETVYLVRSDQSRSPAFRGIPLFTSAKSHPWYTCRNPVSLSLPPSASVNKSRNFYTYRYAIYRGGNFYRWEEASDIPKDIRPFRGDSSRDLGADDDAEEEEPRHEVPLRFLSGNENYVVSDVLGMTTGTANIEKVQAHASPLFASMANMHSRQASSSSFTALSSHGSGSALNSMGGSGGTSGASNTGSKKKVGFAPSPAPYHTGAGKPLRRPVTLKHTDGVVVASAFLPVHLTRSDDGEWTANWDYEALLSMQTHLRVTRIGTVKWRGWHGNYGKDGSPMSGVPEDEREKVERCLQPFNCVPVWCNVNQFGEMYNGFCKEVLWPVFHNVTSVYSSESEGRGSEGQGPLDISGHSSPVTTTSSDDEQFTEYCTDDTSFPIHGDGGKEASLWSAYTNINRQFADAIIQNFHEGDIIWIHGFHLLILPSLLTRRIPMAKIGIFLHTPFPSSEIFRTLWCREDLLRGMLNADQVGFHLFEYARHFLTCCRRLLGLNYGMIPDGCGGHNLAVEVSGRHVTVTSIHAGIETSVCNNILRQPDSIERVKSIRAQFQGKVILCAIDRMESLKGIPIKLLGMERFLLRCPEWVGKIVLVQVGISAFERGDDYTRTRNEVLTMSANINRVWPGTIHFQEFAESQMRLEHRMALLRAADIALVTPIRDGLNLIPLEFTCAHLDALTDAGKRDRRHRGLCILSEFSSCTRVLRGALQVNPWKVSEIANAFYQAVTMTEEERLRRIACASEFVSRVTTQRWALAVMLDLKAVYKDADSRQYSGAGLGLGFRLLGMETGFNALDAGDVGKAYKNTRSRLILLDYGGTILKNDQDDRIARYAVVHKLRLASAPTQRLISSLKNLCADPHNTVFVVSGKERHSLTKTLGTIPNLGLAAEHGMFVSWPTSNVNKTRQWHTLVPEQDRSWRNIAITIMEVYTSRTQGSYIEETEMKVLWQFRDADPEFGYLQSRELEDHLSNVLRSFSVDVLHGGVEEGGYVEVRPKGVNKGVVATHIIKNIPKFSQHRIDFALAIGDDHCDEPMLSVMRCIGRRAVESRWRTGDPPLTPLPSTVTLVDVSSCDPFIHPSLEAFTCTVGKKPSAAKSYVNDVDDVQDLLDTLIRVVARIQHYASMADLRSLNLSDTANISKLAQVEFTKTLNLSQSICAGVTRSSLTKTKPLAPIKDDSGKGLSLTDYLNQAVEDEDEEDDIFF